MLGLCGTLLERRSAQEILVVKDPQIDKNHQKDSAQVKTTERIPLSLREAK